MKSTITLGDSFATVDILGIVRTQLISTSVVVDYATKWDNLILWVGSNFIAKQMVPKMHYFHQKPVKLLFYLNFLVLRMQLIDTHLL